MSPEKLAGILERMPARIAIDFRRCRLLQAWIRIFQDVETKDWGGIIKSEARKGRDRISSSQRIRASLEQIAFLAGPFPPDLGEGAHGAAYRQSQPQAHESCRHNGEYAFYLQSANDRRN